MEYNIIPLKVIGKHILVVSSCVGNSIKMQRDCDLLHLNIDIFIPQSDSISALICLTIESYSNIELLL